MRFGKYHDSTNCTVVDELGATVTDCTAPAHHDAPATDGADGGVLYAVPRNEPVMHDLVRQ